MTKRKQHQTMDNLDSCYKLVQQSSAKGGIRAIKIAEKMGVHKTTVYDLLRSLDLMGKVTSDQGLWKAKTGEQTIKPLEKEIVIELAVPEDKVKDMARLEIIANTLEELDYHLESEKIVRPIIETFNKARTITIRGKNVDELDLEKVANLIKQANERTSNFNLKGILKKLKI
ncbi:MAG: hypothetical protein IAX21_09845 [Candidatus Bathyarchaeota archaeon]|nr:MAG: hypothetical protein IAX21_09845 [Candidatus Bathyarchaeota archaeon]